MTDKVNVLLVDDQPDKLLAYEVILEELGENLVKVSSAREALQFLLKNDVAVVLIDVCMPELDGFQLAAMIREHPRFRKTAIIFISAIHLTDVDRLRGYTDGIDPERPEYRAIALAAADPAAADSTTSVTGTSMTFSTSAPTATGTALTDGPYK